MKKELELYVHIPFCVKKCAYCDFLSFSAKQEEVSAYVEALAEEIKGKKEQFSDYCVTTIFLGGGTPSILEGVYTASIFRALRESFDIAENAEITILEVVTEVLPMLPLAARIAVAEAGHLVVGLEPILQTVVVMVGTGRVAGNIGPRAVGVALLLDGLEDEAVDVVVELRVGRRLDAALREPDAARSALGHADVVDLGPVLARQDDVGHLGAGVMEHVDVHPEVQLRQRVPRLQQIRLVHEVAGHADAAVKLVGGIDLADGVPNGGGVGPGVPEAQKREALGGDLIGIVLERGLQAREGTRSLVVAALAHSDDAGLLIGGDVVAVALHERGVLVLQVLHEVLDQRNLVFHGKVARRVAELHGADALANAPVDRLVVGHDHVGAAAAAVYLGLRGAAVAGGLVGVAGEAGDELQGAGVLHGVSGLVGGQLVVDAAVAVKRVQARGVGAHGLFDLVGGNLGDLGDAVKRVLLQAVLPLLPDRLGLDHLAIGELDLHAVGPQLRVLRQPLRVRLGALLVALAGPVGVVGRIGRVGELGGIGQPAGRRYSYRTRKAPPGQSLRPPGR